jgi:hypothetical protein
MRCALLARLKRLESVQAVDDSNRPLKVEFAYLKLLPREYSGLRHRVRVGQRPDGRGEYEERPGAPAPNQSEGRNENVRRIYFVRAPETGNKNR